MLSSECEELIGDIIALSAQATQIPVALYETDSDGNVVDIVRADDRLPALRKADPFSCHVGLASLTEPIIVDGTSVAVVEYGLSPVTDDSAESASRLNWLRQTLPPIIRRIIYNYVVERERIARAEQAAYHELQLRLQAALAHAENMFVDASEQPPSREAVEDLMSALGTISTVMHSLTQGQYLPEYRFAAYTIRSFVDRAVRLCRAEAARKGVEIDVDLQPENGHVVIHASEPHLQQALNNLLHNAVKYSYPGTGVAERYVSVRGNLMHNGYEVIMTNYGVGIEPDEYDRIFTGGYRGRLTQGEYRTGSGQGLVLVRQVLERHHGRIIVTSRPSWLGGQDKTTATSMSLRGVPYLTSFTVWLPLEQPEEKRHE